MEQLGGRAVFSAPYRQLLDSELNKEINAAVDVIAQHKHGKASEQSANPLRAVQILANVTHLAFGDNTFGMFHDVKKQRFGTKYEGRFRHAHGRPPFVGASDYSGEASFSDNETYFFFSSRRRHPPSTRDWSSDVCSSD